MGDWGTQVGTLRGLYAAVGRSLGCCVLLLCKLYKFYTNFRLENNKEYFS